MRTSTLVACLAVSITACAESHGSGDPGERGDASDSAHDATIPPDTADRDGGGVIGCAEYAREICAQLAACIPIAIWLTGSLERCEELERTECEHDEVLAGVGDRAGARRACLEALDPSCAWVNDPSLLGACFVPGTRGEGEPCRASEQCGAGLVCVTGGSLEPACDSGVCRAPLAEGVTGCGHHACEDGLRCEGVGDVLVCVAPPVAGEPCNGPGSCASGLYCGTGATCEPERSNGETCDPSVPGQCGLDIVFTCDATTARCATIDLALEGEACVDGGEPRCAGPCVDGRCQVDTGSNRPLGSECTTSWQCAAGYGCFDGECGPQPCD